MFVECNACGAHLALYNLATDEQTLLEHATLHVKQDADMRRQFNDSPITFPIQYTEVEQDNDNG